MALLLVVGLVAVVVCVAVYMARSNAQSTREASSEVLHAYVDPIEDTPQVEDETLFDAAQEMDVDEIDVEMAADSSQDDYDRFEAASANERDDEIEFAELLDEAPDYVPDDLLEPATDADGSAEAGEAEEPAAATADDGSAPPLARRTPKERSDSAIGGGELRMAQTNQRPAGQTARSPEEVRSLLSSYRGGLKRGRTNR